MLIFFFTSLSSNVIHRICFGHVKIMILILLKAWWAVRLLTWSKSTRIRSTSPFSPSPPPSNVLTSLQKGYTPLHVACLYNNVKIAKILINNGADVNATNVCSIPYSTLTITQHSCSTHAARTTHALYTILYCPYPSLPLHTSHVTQDGTAIVHSAVWHNLYKITALLIRSGAKINVTDKVRKGRGGEREERREGREGEGR